MKEIIDNIIRFRDERNWQKHDTPSNLSKSIIIEAAELLENFQWSDEPLDMENVKEELADILIYSIAMAHDLGFNIEDMIEDKLRKNAIKYPVEK